MTTPTQLSKFIRFHLGEMGAQNAHHEFEHLARHIAKLRLYSNILPATGPVSSGGDGGRDFETYTTQLKPSSFARTSFAARSSGNRLVVFPCSLEKKIDAKIRADLNLLCEDDEIEEVCYFCEANLPIAKRRRLIAEAQAKGMLLQIFDGSAIAELLAEAELFWIAQEFLHIPAELAPEFPSNDSYIQHRTAWKSRSALPVSRPDFASIKAGLRRSTFETYARGDLSFWQEKMAGFLVKEAPREIVRDAIYEIVVAQLRGRDEMTSKIDALSDFFSDMEAHANVGQLDDAVTLLTYSFGAFWRGVLRVDPEFLFNYRAKLAQILNAELEAAAGPGRRTGLLNAYARLELLPSHPGQILDNQLAVCRWHAMLDSAVAAPLFPIDEFCDFLGTMLKSFGEDKELLALAERADELLSDRAGKDAIGRKAMDRALAFLEQGNSLASIRELHKTKTKWFSGERLTDAFDVLLLLSEQYRGLGLAYAAKYYAMAARGLAHQAPRNTDVAISKATFDILDAEDSAGNSFAYLQLFPVLIAAHIEHDESPFDLEKHPRLHGAIGQLAALLGLLKTRDPSTRSAIDDTISIWPAPLRELILTNADNPAGFWHTESDGDGWTSIEAAFLDRPFGDLGPKRCVNWEASGICWHCRFDNTYSVAPAAEQLIAEFQLVSAALGDRDLGIVCCDVNLEIKVNPNCTTIAVTPSGTEAGRFLVDLPASDRGPDDMPYTVAAFGTVLYACSVLTDEELMEKFDVTVLEAPFIGRPYVEWYRDIMPAELFSEAVRVSNRPFESERQFRTTAECFLPWFHGPGPNYDEGRAIADIGLRYSRITPSIQYTIRNLISDPASHQRLLKLRQEGLRDWEILVVVGNIALNQRLGERQGQSVEVWRNLGQAIMERPESPEQALDPALFTDEHFSACMSAYHGAFLNSWQLRYPECAKPAAIEQFLKFRYRLRDLDLEHIDIFGWKHDAADAVE